MPSVDSTTSANWLKTAPSTQFGTRELTFLKVVATGSDGSTAVNFSTSYTASNSDFSLAVRTIQNFNELYAVGTPDSTGFIAVVAADTGNGSATGTPNTQGTTWTSLEAVITANLANGGSSATAVTELTFDGVAIS